MEKEHHLNIKNYEGMTKEDLIKELEKRDRAEKYPEPILNLKSYSPPTISSSGSLTNEEIARYSRQLILPEIGPSQQLNLKRSSVLIVGCGGLGCPASVYLAAAGIGVLGLVDYDEVEVSNLHRQVLHSEDKVGVPKSSSIASYIKSLNKHVHIVPYHLSLTSSTALNIINNYDIVLDCTDNVATRYLLNDACVLANKTLVSGSALRFEGQLTVYHYENGPCYRCLFPKPPPPETVTNCSDGGVLGVVPGIIGSLQALEAIKIICNFGTIISQKLLLFDALDMQFRLVKLRPHQRTCEICGDSPTIKELIDYEQFCGAKATDKDKIISLVNTESRITVEDYNKLVKENIPHVLIDVRLPVEMEICTLPNALNIPIKLIDEDSSFSLIKKRMHEIDSNIVYCICRRGNDSQIAVSKLLPKLEGHGIIKDIIGGLHAWAKKIDTNFPVY